MTHNHYPEEQSEDFSPEAVFGKPDPLLIRVIRAFFPKRPEIYRPTKKWNIKSKK
jgi:hypothetical protein